MASHHSDTPVDELMKEIRRHIARDQAPAAAAAGPSPLNIETSIDIDMEQLTSAISREIEGCRNAASPSLPGSDLFFAKTAYRLVLDREPDPAELSRAAAILEDNRFGKATLLKTLIETPSSRARLTSLEKTGREKDGLIADHMNPSAGRSAGITGMPEPAETYHVNDLLKFHDREFIDAVFKAILKRDPDHGSLNHYLKGLRNGSWSKIQILGRIRLSPEGRRKGVRICGLYPRFAVSCLQRLPLIGYPLTWSLKLIRLPLIIRNILEHNAWLLNGLTEVRNDVATLNRTIASDSRRTRLEQLKSLMVIQDSLTQLSDTLRTELGDIENRLHSLAPVQDEVSRLSHTIQTFADHHIESDRQFGSIRSEVTKLTDEKQRLWFSIRSLSTQLHTDRLLWLENDQRLRRLLDKIHDRQPQDISPAQAQDILQEKSHLLDGLYAGFEERFRGTSEEIRQRLQVYIPYMKKTGVGSVEAPIIDIGCGRGEWLGLCADNGLDARGVDMNRVMVATCLESGLDVVESEAIDFLRHQPAESFGALTGFQIVEHLPLETLIVLLDEALRVVKPGGLILFETPNPENLITGACNFYMDPTHRNPIPPAALAYLMEIRGYTNIRILRLNENRSQHIDNELLQHLLFGPQDYAIIARKTDSLDDGIE